VERPLKIEREKLKGDLISSYDFQVSSFHWYYCIRCSSCGTPLNNDFSGYTLRIIFDTEWECNTDWNTRVYVYIYTHTHNISNKRHIYAFITANFWPVGYDTCLLNQKCYNTRNGALIFKCTLSIRVNVIGWRQAGETRFESWFIGSLWHTQWIWNIRHNTHYSLKWITMS
jgi:hypothetical protein